MTRFEKQKAAAAVIVHTLKTAKQYLWDGRADPHRWKKQKFICYAIHMAEAYDNVSAVDSHVTKQFINRALDYFGTSEDWLMVMYGKQLSTAEMQLWRLMWIDKMIDDLTTKYKL